MAQIATKKRLYSTSALATVVGRAGDYSVDTTKSTIVVFDGVTAGGIPLALDSKVYPNATNSTAGFESAADHVYIYTHTHPNATAITAGFMSAADYNLLQSLGSGPSAPAATGNVPNTLVLRDSSGNFAANVITASLIGNASTATNGVVTTGSYSDPSWIVSLNANKLTGVIPSGVTWAGTLPWTQVTGKPTVVSFFINDAGYINGSGNTTGTSGGVLSTGGRETASPTPNTMIIRNGSGTAQIATPVSGNDIANKAYVDAAAAPAYQPVNVSAVQFAPFTTPTQAAFNTTVLNFTGAGFIKTILINTTTPLIENWVPSPPGAPLANIYIGITVDGATEYLQPLWPTFLLGFAPNGPSGSPGLATSQYFMCDVHIPFTSSIVVRFTSQGVSFTGTSQPSAPCFATVNWFVKTA